MWIYAYFEKAGHKSSHTIVMYKIDEYSHKSPNNILKCFQYRSGRVMQFMADSVSCRVAHATGHELKNNHCLMILLITVVCALVY